MNKRVSVFLVLPVVMVAALVIGGVWWYYTSQEPIASQSISIPEMASSTNTTSTPTTFPQQTIALPPFSFSCPQNSTTTLTAYENKQMGIAFCYPSDLIVSTGTIKWPTTGTLTPQISFWIFNDDNSSNVFGYLAACDASGSQGDDYCVPPISTQITEGRNVNGFNYVLFRHDIVFGNEGGAPPKYIYNNDAGPSAFVPLINQNYLAFAIVDSLYQANGFGALPSYVDKDLLEILNTVSIMPEQYTGVGLTLTSNSSGAISIYNVIANSPAAAQGIKDGEIIVGINGTSTASMNVDQVANILDVSTGTIDLNIQKSRGQAPMTFRLNPETFVVSGSDLAAMYENPF